MKLEFKAKNPHSLKSDIAKLITENKLQTWAIHPDSKETYLKHTHQWGEKGVIWLTVDFINSALIVKVRKFEKTTERIEDFEGYYLGRFCELMFVNFPDRFTSIDNVK